MKILLRYILVLTILITGTIIAQAKGAAKTADTDHVFTLVLDPGHGGHDTGCVGRYSRESELVLKISKLLEKKLKDEFGKKIKVVLTRNTDTYLTLQRRADIANSNNGDLFISVHINSVAKRTRNRASFAGASVYTCGLHKSESNLEVAMRENAVMELDPDYETQYQGFDPNSSESYIIFELSQHKHLQESVKFASMVQDRLVNTAGRADKGVRQAGFWVLWSTSMPSVLVELDFLCNPTQEKFLSSDAGQEKCAQAMFEAVQDYVAGKINK